MIERIVQQKSRMAVYAVVVAAGAAAAFARLPRPQSETPPTPQPLIARQTPIDATCNVNLELRGMMRDIISNALTLGLGRREADVREFLDRAPHDSGTSQELLRDTARHFGIDEAALAAEVELFRHCNCTHGAESGAPGLDRAASDDAPIAVSRFAADVTLHVVLHELGHALIREFDLPVLGNEETMADAFATHYLTTRSPERALAVLTARATSLMIEARDVPRAEWAVAGEHDNDARRAFQIAALAVAVDRDKYAPVAQAAGLSERDMAKAIDYGAEIHRSWRRVLSPLWMPDGELSKEARVECGEGLAAPLRDAGLIAEVESAVQRFDWHSTVEVRFAPGDGRAGWSRSERAITVHSNYLRRFIEQGKLAGF